MRLKSKTGMTLIELVITMVVLGIIAYVAADAILSGTKAFFSTDYRKEAMDQARVSMERMVREMRNLRDNASVTISTATRFSFTDINGNAIDFNWINPNITRNGSTLSSNISSLNLTYLRADGVTTDPTFSSANTKRIRIAITALVAGETIQLQTDVWPRCL